MTLLISHFIAKLRLAIDLAPLLLALLLHRRCLFASLEAKAPISTTADLFSATDPSKLFVKSEEPLYICAESEVTRQICNWTSATSTSN